MLHSYLQWFLEHVKAEWVDNEYIAPCPLVNLYHPTCSTNPYKVVISPGSTKPIVFYCRVCGKSRSQEICEGWGLTLSDLGKPMSANDIRQLWIKHGELTKHWLVSSCSLSVQESVGSDQQNHSTIDNVVTHRVYGKLLQNLTLTDEHRKWLHRQGFNDQLIEYFQYRSASNTSIVDSEAAKVPGFKQIHADRYLAVLRYPSILIPCRDGDGYIYAMKMRIMDGRKDRMRMMSSKKWDGPNARSDLHFARNKYKNIDEVIVTEGERKADLISSHLKPLVISVPGVSCIDKFINWYLIYTPRRINLAFDQDKAGEQATTRLIDMLNMCNSKSSVYKVSWDSKYKGLDDAFAADCTEDYELIELKSLASGFIPHDPNNIESFLSSGPLNRSELEKYFTPLQITMKIRNGSIKMEKVKGTGQILSLP